jgi:hypothetical protein
MKLKEEIEAKKARKAWEKEADKIIYMELCERMPWRPWVKVPGHEDPCTLIEVYRSCFDSGMCNIGSGEWNPYGKLGTIKVGDIRPGLNYYYPHEVMLYLRPYKTITEEEFAVLDRYYNLMRTFPHVMVDYQRFVRSRHLDYLDLIGKGYAVEAPPEMYKLPKVKIKKEEPR